MQRPSQKILKRVGLLADQQGIMNRYLAEGSNWETHLTKTKNFIQNCFPSDPSASVAVLGSGWMLDIPAVFLLENFREVIFYDIHHPSGIIKKYNSFPNVSFCETDLTGGLIEGVYHICSHWRKRDTGILLTEFSNRMKDFILREDFVFSVNLLTQLDILIIDHLKKYYKPDERLMNGMRTHIQQHHLRMLPRGRSGLITDYEEVHLTSDGEEVAGLSLIYCVLPKAEREEKWLWEFDTRKTYHTRW